MNSKTNEYVLILIADHSIQIDDCLTVGQLNEVLTKMIKDSSLGFNDLTNVCFVSLNTHFTRKSFLEFCTAVPESYAKFTALETNK